MLIEDAASGTSLIPDLGKDLGIVHGCKPSGDKTMRMNAQTANIENGFVYLPGEAPWLPDLEHELMMFPKGRYNVRKHPAFAQFSPALPIIGRGVTH